MNENDFKKTDDSLMKKMQPIRERRIAPEFLKGFAASVTRRIESKKQAAPRPLGLRALVPVFAVLVMAAVIVLRLPASGGRIPAPLPEAVVEIAQLPEAVQDVEAAIAEEIEALKELGAWTEEDETAAGVEAGEEEEVEEVLA